MIVRPEIVDIILHISAHTFEQDFIAIDPFESIAKIYDYVKNELPGQ